MSAAADWRSIVVNDPLFLDIQDDARLAGFALTPMFEDICGRYLYAQITPQEAMLALLQESALAVRVLP